MQIQGLKNLTPEQQENIKKEIEVQQLVNKMQMYGRQVREIDGRTYIEKAHEKGQHYNDRVIDFKDMSDGAKWAEIWVEGEKYPIRGALQPDRIKGAIEAKKIVSIFAKSLAKGSIFTKLFKAIGIFFMKESILDYMDFILRDVRYPEPILYCQPCRELYRIINNEKIRDIACPILENDTAYRYRFQDLMGELSKDNIVKDPIKEIKRLMNISFTRQPDGDAFAKLKKVMPLVYLYLRINKKLLKEIQQTILRANIDELKLSLEDVYWTNRGYESYNFGGIPHKQRFEEYQLTKNN
jgi:hypothetical protein